jgi:hypothetical protein
VASAVAVVDPKVVQIPKAVGTRKQQIAVGFPHNGLTHAVFTVSMAEMVRFEFQRPNPDYFWSTLCVQGGSLVHNNRHGLVLAAIDEQADWLLQLDTDISFPETLLRDLFAAAMETKARVVSGLYWQLNVENGEFVRHPLAFRINEKGRFENIAEFGSQWIDGAGAGCLMVHRSVLEEMKSAQPREVAEKGDPYWSEKCDGVGKPLGEDLSFCWRLHEMGERIWLAAGPKLRHWKLMPVGDQ